MAETENVKNKLSSFLSSAKEKGKSLFNDVKENVKEGADKVQEIYEEHERERKADELYRKLGKKVYKLVSREELALPECCDKYLDSLKELLADAPAEDVKEEEAAEENKEEAAEETKEEEAAEEK